MKTYSFAIELLEERIDQTNFELISERIYSSGCSDALVYAIGQTVYVEFDRDAISLEEALESARNHISQAGFTPTKTQFQYPLD